MSGTSASRAGRVRVLIVDEADGRSTLRIARGCAPHAAVRSTEDGR